MDQTDLVVASVVMATTGSPWLGAQLAALAAQVTTVPWELIVVDNAVEPVDVALPPTIPSARVVEARVAHDPSYARNVGVSVARGRVLLFCDDDDVVDPGWLDALVAAIDGGADLATGRLDEVVLNPEPVRWWRPPMPTDGLVVPHGFLPAGSTASLAVRTEVFVALDGFTWMDRAQDIDLCWRAQLAGYQLRFAADAVVAYRYRQDLRGHIAQHRSYGKATAGLLQAFGDHGLRRPWVEALASVPRMFRPRTYRGRPFSAGAVLGEAARVVGLFEALRHRHPDHRPGLSAVLPPA